MFGCTKNILYWKLQQLLETHENYALYMFTGALDKDYLQDVGGVENYLFINVPHTEADDDNETLAQPQIISHSPYYEDEIFS